MPKLNIIWAIVRGSYSDYRVIAIFQDEVTAKQWIETMNAELNSWDDPYELSNFPFVEEKMKPSKVTHFERYVILSNNGEAKNESENSETDWLIVLSRFHIFQKRPVVKYFQYDTGACQLTVSGFDKDHVDKAFHDRIAMWKANRTIDGST